VTTRTNADGAGYLFARVVAEVLSPAVVVLVLSFVVAWRGTGHDVPGTVAWALVVAVFYSVVPMAVAVRGARRGYWGGHWVRERERRITPLLVCLGSTLLGLAILLVGQAPSEMVALAGAMIATLAACLAITRWWKVSIHAAVAGGATALVTLLYGPVMLVTGLVVVLVGWSRVRVAAHTVTQVAVGALVGPVIGGAVFLLLR